MHPTQRILNMSRMSHPKLKDASTLESLLPSLELSKEATLSEFSFEVESAGSACSSRKSLKYAVVATFLGLLFIPMIVFVLLMYLQNSSDGPASYKNGLSHVAMTSCGPVEGIARDGGFEYRGIPYTALPSEEAENVKRWEPAATVSRLEHCWKDVLPFNPNPAECFQISSEGQVTGADDCLTLDVYTPRSGYEDPSHVVVVLAVPTLAGGWPSKEDFKKHATPTAGFAAERDTVYVVPRFRLGPAGFLPRLFVNQTEFNPNITDFNEEINKARAEREALESSYNLAISDIVAALSWIQLNIENFGGESRSITLLGWGAGSTLVTALTSITNLPGFPFLFTQAWTIGGSGYPVSESVGSNTQFGVALWENSPCSNGKYNAKCLFNLTTVELFKSVPKEWIRKDLNRNHPWLHQDSYWLQTPVEEAWASGKITHDVPLVIGTGAEEVFQFPDSTSYDLSDLNTFVKGIQGSIPADLLETRAANHSQLTRLVSDLTVNCPLRNLARKASAHFSSNVFFYVSDWGTPEGHSVGLNDLSAILGNAPSSAAARNIQQLFFDFLHDAALPRHVPASSGVYLVGDDVTITSNYSFCQNLQLEPSWRKLALLN